MRETGSGRKQHARPIVQPALLLSLLLVLASCSGGASRAGTTAPTTSTSRAPITTTTLAPPQGPPIKIGAAVELTGATAVDGTAAAAAMQIAVDNLNAGRGVLGHTVQLVVKDSQSKPELAVAEATKLVQEDHVVSLLAPTSDAAALGVSTSVSGPTRTPLLNYGATTDALTMTNFQPFVFSLTPNASMLIASQAKSLARDKYKKFGLIATDDDSGHAAMASFKEVVAKENGDAAVVSELYAKPGESTYAPYLDTLSVAKPDIVFSWLTGADLVAFTRQAAVTTFFDQVPFTAMYDAATLALLGADGPRRTRGFGRAPFFAIKTPQAAAVVLAFKAKTSHYPSDVALMAYDAVMVWAEGVESAKSTAADDVVSALESSKFKTLRGEVSFRKLDHQADVPQYYGTVTNPDPTFSSAIWINPHAISGSDTLPSESQVLKRRSPPG